MPDQPLITRFAPSPSGSLHLGNARTALYSWLAARGSGGRFVLRVEDTDAARSDDGLLGRQLAELRWLGLDWDEGPDVGGPNGPYRQSARAASHREALGRLDAAGFTYPCFCSPETLEFSRKAQLAAGRPPRYARTCAKLDAAEVRRRIGSGERPAIRFRVPDGRAIEFVDAVHGPQRFLSEDIGDFVVQRADGSVSFFLGNALDDSAMGITLVIRGDDHLANTPRQRLILEALGLRVPDYAHLPLVLGTDGRPLSKREGALSLSDLREQGYLPSAVCNYLARLGHTPVRVDHAGPVEDSLDLPSLARAFDIGRASHSAARYDEAQLRHWQRLALSGASGADVERWLGERLEVLEAGPRRSAFVGAVRGNVLLPADVESWVGVVARRDVEIDREASAQIAEAGPEFFERALAAFDGGVERDFRGWIRAAGEATGRKGARLFMPLRAALTGVTHGPELAPLVDLLGAELTRHRLERARALALAA